MMQEYTENVRLLTVYTGVTETFQGLKITLLSCCQFNHDIIHCPSILEN